MTICTICSSGSLLDNHSCKNCGRHNVSYFKLENDIQSGTVKFATHFTSPAFCVFVGPRKKAYYPHRNTLIVRVPYFKKMLTGALQGKESSEGSATLDCPADTEEAFEMVLEYAYNQSYRPIDRADVNAKCLLHARVYVLAERLCMDDLKLAALEKMIDVLGDLTSQQTERRDRKTSETYYWYKNKISQETLTEVLELVYANTPGDVEVGDYLDKTVTGETSKEGQKAEFEIQEVRADKMRILLSRYAASRMEDVKKCKELMALVKADGDLAKDIVSAAASGTKVNRGEMQRL